MIPQRPQMSFGTYELTTGGRKSKSPKSSIRWLWTRDVGEIGEGTEQETTGKRGRWTGHTEGETRFFRLTRGMCLTDVLYAHTDVGTDMAMVEGGGNGDGGGSGGAAFRMICYAAFIDQPGHDTAATAAAIAKARTALRHPHAPLMVHNVRGWMSSPVPRGQPSGTKSFIAAVAIGFKSIIPNFNRVPLTPAIGLNTFYENQARNLNKRWCRVCGTGKNRIQDKIKTREIVVIFFKTFIIYLLTVDTRSTYVFGLGFFEITQRV